MTKAAFILLCLVGCGADHDVQMGTYAVTSWIHSVPPDTTFTIAPTASGGIEVTSDSDLFVVDMTDIPGDGTNYSALKFTAFTTSCEAGPYKTCNFGRREVIVTAPNASTVRIDQCNESRTDWTSCSASPICTEERAEQEMASACQRFDSLAGTLVQ